MDNTAVLIDGGYLANILKRYFGEPRIDYARLVQWACQDSPLFRAYYYDCVPYQSSPPTEEERTMVSRKQSFLTALSRLPRFTVRTGILEYRGTDDRGHPIFQQKRVDLQIGLDASMLVHRNVVGTITIITGHSDLIPAVNMAKNNGVIVRLVHGPHRTYHQDLWDAVDERAELSAEVLSSLIRR